jgi:hypothetical protein
VRYGEGTVVVAMIAVRMVEVPADQIVRVVAVGNRLVAAARPVDVSRLVAAALVAGCANIGIVLADCNRMLRRATIFLVAQAAVVQIVDVPVMLDLDVPAIGTVLVVVLRR